MATPAPLAARYTDPAPRSLRPVDESYFAARSGERVLITGASGMLGRETAIALLRAGYDVRVFQRSDAGIAALLPDTIRPRFEQVRGSLNNAEVIEQALVGVDGIVHAAAKVSVSGDWEDYERFLSFCMFLLLRLFMPERLSSARGTGWHPPSMLAETMLVPRRRQSLRFWRRTARSSPRDLPCAWGRYART